MKNEKTVIREIAREVMDIADQHGYGLGECGWYFNLCALEKIEDCNGLLDYDTPYDAIPKDPKDRCTGDHAAHLKLAEHLAREADDMAEKLQELGINSFN
jgi:hypothetical protein